MTENRTNKGRVPSPEVAQLLADARSDYQTAKEARDSGRAGAQVQSDLIAAQREANRKYGYQPQGDE